MPGEVEFGSLETPPTLRRALLGAVEHPGGPQRPLDGIGGPPRVNGLFNCPQQVGEVTKGSPLLQFEPARHRLGHPLQLERAAEVPRQAIRHDHRRPQPVAMLEHKRPGAVPRLPLRGIARGTGHHGAGGGEQLLRPLSLPARLQQVRGGNRANRAQAGLTTPPAFQLAGMHLEGMEAVRFQPAIPNRQCCFDLAVAGQHQLGQSPGDRQAGTCQQGNLKLAGPLDHREGVCVFPGEVLVVEHRGDLAAPLEGVGDRIEEPPPGILVLPCHRVMRVVAMLPDAQHPRDLQSVRSQRQRLVNSRDNGEPIPCRQVAAEIGLGKLIDIHRGDAEVGTRPAILPPAFQDLAQDHIGVAGAMIDRADRRNGQLRPGRAVQQARGRGRCRFGGQWRGDVGRGEPTQRRKPGSRQRGLQPAATRDS